MNKITILLILLIIVILAVFISDRYQASKIDTFEECARMYPILETYPEQCNTPDGKHFTKQY